MAVSAGLFDKQKETCLAGVDLSRKGSIDEPIAELVRLINEQNEYFTTSSCSGRLIVVEQAEGKVKKKGCRWLFTSHDVIDQDKLVSSLTELEGDAVFKFEPLVLHIQCRSVEYAQKLHACAVASGFRNSGITIGSKGKIITAVRSTHSLEVPLSQGSNIMVSNEYLKFLTECGNTRMKENFRRIERFHKNFKEMLQAQSVTKVKRKKEKNKDNLPCKDQTIDRDTTVIDRPVQMNGSEFNGSRNGEEDLDTDFLFGIT